MPGAVVAQGDFAGLAGDGAAGFEFFLEVFHKFGWEQGPNEVKITLMLNFRQFEIGPDPFGRKWAVLFKWLQTAISLRHSDTVDVKFVLQSEDTRVQKQIAMPHAELLELSRHTGHEMSDAWCARLAALHLKCMVESGEDLEKDLVTVRLHELAGYAAEIAREEDADMQARRGAA